MFSTKDRRPVITARLQERLWPFLGGIARPNNDYRKEHARKVNFQEELILLIEKHISCMSRSMAFIRSVPTSALSLDLTAMSLA